MSDTIRVEVVYAERGRAWRLPLELPRGATVGELLARLPGRVSHWPAAAFAADEASSTLADGDRLELLRALPTDPKQARRARAETTKPR